MTMTTRARTVEVRHPCFRCYVFGLLVVALLAVCPSFAAADAQEAIERGRALLEEQTYDQATAVFREVLDADPRNVQALHGLGLCQYAGGDRTAAAETLRRAAEIAGDAIDAALANNLAAIELELDRPMAALQACVRHLQRVKGVPDENVLNALGIALVRVMAENGSSKEVQAAGALYVRLNAKLEATRPGLKRFGTEWIPADEFQAGAVPVFPPAIEMVSLGSALAEAPQEPAVADGPAVAPGDAVAVGHNNANPADNATADPKSVDGVAVPIGPQLLLAPSHVVGTASKVQLESPQGNTIEARVVRTDEPRGLALLKVDGTRMAYFNLADQCQPGEVECAAVVQPTVFNIVPEIVPGKTAVEDDAWRVYLQSAPRFVGSPVLQGGKIVGIVVDSPRDGAARLIPVQDFRPWLGAETPRHTSLPADPRRALYRVTPRD